MGTSTQNLRFRAFNRQAGCCFYCGRPMWIDDVRSFSRQFGISLKQARVRQCTAEHLKARCDGGSCRRDNIVAACLHCNRRRHRRKKPLSPERWRAIQVARARRIDDSRLAAKAISSAIR